MPKDTLTKNILNLKLTEEDFFTISSALLECRNESYRMARKAESESQRDAYNRRAKVFDKVNTTIDSQVWDQTFSKPIPDTKIKMLF